MYIEKQKNHDRIVELCLNKLVNIDYKKLIFKKQRSLTTENNSDHDKTVKKSDFFITNQQDSK